VVLDVLERVEIDGPADLHGAGREGREAVAAVGRCISGNNPGRPARMRMRNDRVTRSVDVTAVTPEPVFPGSR
jgi:hypothetical protein